MQNLHQLFDWQYIGQITGGDFAKFCGLLRIYELYQMDCFNTLYKRALRVWMFYSVENFGAGNAANLLSCPETILHACD